MGYKRITVNANQMGGAPFIRGLRIPVATVVAMAAEGMTEAAQDWRSSFTHVATPQKPASPPS